MHDTQRDVEAFHRALALPIGESPTIRRAELRAALIEEEAREAVSAIRRGDLIDAIDGLCDLIYVAYGAATEFGVDLAPFWDEVHRSNIAKRGGPIRDDGKLLKPPNWTPPDIAGVLASHAGGDVGPADGNFHGRHQGPSPETLGP
jgi:predicted HAD superfamily Cof-like phosphohydrolase